MDKKHVIAIVALVLCTALGIGAAAAIDRNGPSPEMPEDFSFALTWGVFGIRSYDSATGKLVKTSTERIETEYQLTEQERQQIWEWICRLKPETYPDEYDPNPDMGCDPSETLILTVRTAEGEKTITAYDTAYAESSGDAKGDLFLKTCRAIQHLLTDTEAWQAMPDGVLEYC